MTREERCKLAIERGFTYNPENGEVYSRYGKISKSMHKNGYIDIQITLNKKKYHLLAHQFGWYWVYKECVECLDHINGIRNDNRICNLRSITNQQNQWNRTTAKGFFWNKQVNKWQSQIQLNKKTIYLGTYNIKEEARNAYLQAKEKHHVIQKHE
jgi:hypothetical protein